MSVFRRLEHTIESTFDRGFRRAFRSQLQPVELARKLAREMDLNKTISVSKIYVPNEYTVHLSEPDNAAFESYQATLVQELVSYLDAHARSSGFSLIATPTVTIVTDTALRAGEFGISCRMVDAPAHDASSPAEIPLGAVAIPVVATPPPLATENAALAGVSGTQVISAAEVEAAGLTTEAMTIIMNGQRFPLSARVTSIGRSKERDIVVPDGNVSRDHCEIRHVGYDYFLIDLDSTNGISVNGHPVTRHALAHGDVITLGATELRVEVS
jgi:hypothetical protein